VCLSVREMERERKLIPSLEVVAFIISNVHSDSMTG